MDKYLFAFFIIAYLLIEVDSLIEFTDLKCESVDTNFAEFEYCRLETGNRTYRYITAKLLLFEKPVSKVRINGALYKRSNGYKPFLYNVTVDACKLIKNQKSQPVSREVFNLFKGASNMNHTCPYDHDLYVDHLSADYLNQRLPNILTFPKGDYLLQMHVIVYDIKRIVIKLYFSQT